MRFVKLHGLGNDYLVLRAFDLPFPLTADVVRAICDRHTGVGSDGILLEVPPEQAGADVGLRIFNPDGSEAQKSGNGLRIFGRYLESLGRLGGGVVVDTKGGLARVEPLPDGNFRVEMGRATFASQAIPVAGPEREVVDEAVAVEGERLTITAVSVGNPHCVVFGEGWSLRDLERFGPRLEHHALFPERTNVQLAEALDPHTVRILVWERGAGHTLASGSSASAVAAAGVRLGRLLSPVRVLMEGGELLVEVDSEMRVVQSGPAEEVARGELTAAFVERLRRLASS